MKRVCKCGAPLPRNAKRFCLSCRAERRVKQLTKSHKRWLRRRRNGRASHHIFYNGQLSAWARENPVKALKLWHRRNPLAEAPDELIRSLCTVS